MVVCNSFKTLKLKNIKNNHHYNNLLWDTYFLICKLQYYNLKCEKREKQKYKISIKVKLLSI